MTIKADDILRAASSTASPKTRSMPRPIILGVVGDSAAGKTTLTRGLVRVLGEENVTHVCADDYHRYDRRQRAEPASRRCTPTATTWTSWPSTSRHLRAASRS